jgi:O-antigen/teichoic acid export membrane protein
MDGPQVLGISAPIFVINLAEFALTNFSIWIVGAFLTSEDIALYGAAWRLVNVVALPFFIVNLAVLPFISELNARNEKAGLQDALRGTATLASLPALAILLVFMTLGREVMGFVYGDHYRQAASILVILCVGQLVNVWTGSCAQVLTQTGHQRQFMIQTLLTGALSAALAVIAVKHYGLVGVAVAASAGRTLQNLCTWMQVHRLTGLWTHATLNPSFLRMSARRARA